MNKPIFGIILFLFLLPIPTIFSQEYTDTNPTLTISMDSNSNFVYQDSEGYTVVIGLIENNDPLAFLTNVVIEASFYDDLNPNPLEVKEGTTLLKVIPPNSKSPFIIRSDNPNITQIFTKFLTFDTSEIINNSLNISINDVSLQPMTSLSDGVHNLSFLGILQNGDVLISDTVAHLAFYDVFNRIIQISTIEIGDVDANELVSLKLNEEINPSSVGFLLFSESDKFYSNVMDVKIPPPQIIKKLVAISNVTVNDTLGRTLSEIKIGDSVKINSETIIYDENAGKWNQTPYTFYIQIKEDTSNPDVPPTIEHIGKSDGKFLGNGIKLQSLNWIPEKQGLFFIETFLWDENNVPIAVKGPLVSVLVN